MEDPTTDVGGDGTLGLRSRELRSRKVKTSKNSGDARRETGTWKAYETQQLREDASNSFKRPDSPEKQKSGNQEIDELSRPSTQGTMPWKDPLAMIRKSERVIRPETSWIRKDERDSVETFMWDKQRGQYALQRRRQLREDILVQGTERALEYNLERQGVYLADKEVVLEDEEAFEDPNFGPKLPLTSYAELYEQRFHLERQDSIHKNIDPRLAGHRNSRRRSSARSSIDGDASRAITEDELQAAEEKRRRKEEEALQEQQEQRERAEKIFFFYEQVDQVVARIANTLTSINKSERHFALQLGDKFVNDPAIKAAKDIQTSRMSLVQLLGTSDPDIAPQKAQEVSFYTEEEAEEFRSTKESFDALSQAINVATFAETLHEVGEWIHGRKKQSMDDEKDYFSLMQQVEEQEAEAEGSSRSVRLMLREKEQLAESSIKRFGKKLQDAKSKGKQMLSLLAQMDAETTIRHAQQVQESIAMLEYQITILRGRIFDADGKIKEQRGNDKGNPEVEKAMQAEQARQDKASAEILRELEKVQAKSAVLSKQVAVSNDVVQTLRHLDQQVKLQLVFKLKAKQTREEAEQQHQQQLHQQQQQQRQQQLERQAEEGFSDGQLGKPGGETVSDDGKMEMPPSSSQAVSPSQSQDKQNIISSTDAYADDIEDNGDISDASSVASDASEQKAEISTLKDLVRAAEEEKKNALEAKKKREDDLRKRKEELEAMPSGLEREARLVDRVNELKQKRDAQKNRSLDAVLFEQQSQKIKFLETRREEVLRLSSRFKERIANAKSALDDVESRLDEANDELLLYKGPVKKVLGRSTTSRRGRANTMKQRELRGAMGDVGPEGDEAGLNVMIAAATNNSGGEEIEEATLEELRSLVAKAFEAAYAPYYIDPETGDRMGRDRLHATVVRSEQLGEVLMRAEEPTVAQELEATQNDIVKIQGILARLEADTENTRSTLAAATAEEINPSRESDEIHRRYLEATKSIDRIQKSLAHDRELLNSQRRSVQTSHEEELRSVLDGMETMNREVLQLKERVTIIAKEANERQEHSERAQELLKRQQQLHRKMFTDVSKLREEVRQNQTDNPGQRAKRVRRQIQALELENIKLNRKLRDMRSQLQKKQFQARKRAEARAMALQMGREPEPLSELDQLFRDDDETRARKTALRKSIKKAIHKLSRWRYRWQVAKRAASHASTVQHAGLTATHPSSNTQSFSTRLSGTGIPGRPSNAVHSGGLLTSRSSYYGSGAFRGLESHQIVSSPFHSGHIDQTFGLRISTQLANPTAGGPAQHRLMAELGARQSLAVEARRRASLGASGAALMPLETSGVRSSLGLFVAENPAMNGITMNGIKALSVGRPAGSPSARQQESPRRRLWRKQTAGKSLGRGLSARDGDASMGFQFSKNKQQQDFGLSAAGVSPRTMGRSQKSPRQKSLLQKMPRSLYDGVAPRDLSKSTVNSAPARRLQPSSPVPKLVLGAGKKGPPASATAQGQSNDPRYDWMQPVDVDLMALAKPFRGASSSPKR